MFNLHKRKVTTCKIDINVLIYRMIAGGGVNLYNLMAVKRGGELSFTTCKIGKSTTSWQKDENEHQTI